MAKREKPKEPAKDPPKPEKFETITVQASMGDKVETRLDCKDQMGRKVQGHVFDVEIARAQIKTVTELHQLEDCFDGNPVKVVIHNQTKTLRIQFQTVTRKLTREVKAENLRVLKAKIVAFNHPQLVVDKLHSMMLEDLIYLSFTRYTPALGEFANPAPHKKKETAKKPKPPKNPRKAKADQTGIDFGGDAKKDK